MGREAGRSEGLVQRGGGLPLTTCVTWGKSLPVLLFKDAITGNQGQGIQGESGAGEWGGGERAHGAVQTVGRAGGRLRGALGSSPTEMLCAWAPWPGRALVIELAQCRQLRSEAAGPSLWKIATRKVF